jgi:hypothetical protein
LRVIVKARELAVKVDAVDFISMPVKDEEWPIDPTHHLKELFPLNV